MKNLDALLHHPASPLQLIEHEVFSRSDLRLFVKRDDLLHPLISGNKWRKLKHNLREAERLGYSKLVTFGGAFSNHIAATAAAGEAFGFSTLGVVSGEEIGAVNPTLSFARQCGMNLIFTSRANLRNYSETELLKLLEIEHSDAFILPQGGANCLALLGCREIISETVAQHGFAPDYFITACGTGATLAGIASGLTGESKALGIAVLKGGFLNNEVEKLLLECFGDKASNFANWALQNDFHFGGYAKWTPELIEFINDFKKKTGIPLDPIYNGKAFFATFQLAMQGFFPAGSTIVLVHTGGLQGIVGFNERFDNILH
ncbi:MAG: pyridoxal-phosphate dependent enzyme [Bacteroidetes bacterium]|nr:pyridoxal-phosphate dependent enzyme [Bacteroidota bacterium]